MRSLCHPHIHRGGFRSLFHLYNSNGFSIWNSYALICTSVAAQIATCERSKPRCGHESSSQNRTLARQARRIAVFCCDLPCPAFASRDLGEVRCVDSNISRRLSELREPCVPNTISKI